MTDTGRDTITVRIAATEPGRHCTGHRGPITEASCFADADGFAWCIACVTHMTTCVDTLCDHPAIVCSCGHVFTGRQPA